MSAGEDRYFRIKDQLITAIKNQLITAIKNQLITAIKNQFITAQPQQDWGLELWYFSTGS